MAVLIFFKKIPDIVNQPAGFITAVLHQQNLCLCQLEKNIVIADTAHAFYNL